MKFRPPDTAVAYFASGLLHAGVVLLVVISAAPLVVNPQGTTVNTTIGSDSAAPNEQERSPHEIETASDVVLDKNDAISPADGLDALVEADVGSTRIAAFARQKLEQARAEAAQKSAAQQLADLESLGRQLNQVSNQESVAAVAEAVAPWLGSTSRASEPTSDVEDAGPFDPLTAQFYEVHRHGDAGAYEYVAVMLDAAGRTQQVSLDDADGAELYDLFQLMKTFPLLETVYRKAALGLLDALAAEERSTTTAAAADSQETQPSRSGTSGQNQN